MLILALESSAKASSCAILKNGALLAQCCQNSGLTHSVTLLPMVEDMLKNCGVKLSELELIAAANGPGSFTGIRIGVSLAKGLAYGLDIPAAGVSTLAAMAWHGISAPPDSIICCVMDARRGQVYNAVFEVYENASQRLCADRAISIEDLSAELETKYSGKRIILIGDVAEKCAETFENTAIRNKPPIDFLAAPEPLRLQSAWGVAMEAMRTPAGDCHGLNPVYLRPFQKG